MRYFPPSSVQTYDVTSSIDTIILRIFTYIVVNMEQSPVNQRLKFLIEKLGISARAFSEIVGESPTNVHNYTGKRNSMPGADFLEKVLLHFDNVNPTWLVAGKGEPFLSDPQTGTTQTGNFNQAGTSNKQTIKGNKGGVQANSGGDNTINNIELNDCKRDLAAAKKEIGSLTSQLVDKERIIRLLEKGK